MATYFRFQFNLVESKQSLCGCPEGLNQPEGLSSVMTDESLQRHNVYDSEHVFLCVRAPNWGGFIRKHSLDFTS